jgi:hypothetical protein
MFDQARANSIFDVLAAAILDDDRFNAPQTEKPRKHKPGWARADDPDLCPHETFLPLVFL